MPNVSSYSYKQTGNAAFYIAVGPLPGPSILAQINTTVFNSASGTFQLAFSLGINRDVDSTMYARGARLLSQSNDDQGAQPGTTFYAGNNQQRNLTLYPHIPLPAGGNYLYTRGKGSVGGADVYVLIVEAMTFSLEEYAAVYGARREVTVVAQPSPPTPAQPIGGPV